MGDFAGISPVGLPPRKEEVEEGPPPPSAYFAAEAGQPVGQRTTKTLFDIDWRVCKYPCDNPYHTH